MRAGLGSAVACVRWPVGAGALSAAGGAREGAAQRTAGDRGQGGGSSCSSKMGSKQITQETFDDAVQENITEFEMDPEEAVREAVQQFESQGVDLSNIVKAVRPPASENGQKQKHEILLTLDALGKAVDDSDLAEVAEQLVVFTAQCKEQLAFRCLAGQNGAYPVVFSACQVASGDRNLMLKAFYTLSALLDGQPDLLDTAGQDLLLQTLQEYREDADMVLAGIRCVRHACLKHEQNRQDFVKGGILPLLTGAIVQHRHSADVVRTASSALRIMTFDDDIRVPFGHAHDHAKMIVLENDGLRVLIEAAKGKIHPMLILVLNHLDFLISEQCFGITWSSQEMIQIFATRTMFHSFDEICPERKMSVPEALRWQLMELFVSLSTRYFTAQCRFTGTLSLLRCCILAKKRYSYTLDAE
ncbi:armadillo repeat-containing protein 6 isoform X4 [Lathamus discolor]|uniref:armadillo repeat-containing protein 6 isoform X4 n=1 Tax=Lathamus discolor TaxID=678569 RepID=UPI0032B7B969